jgi:large subunit ribosomal protein L28
MAKCQKCGKGPQFGQNRPFSLKATNRRFNVNVQTITVTEGGHTRRVRLCTRCLRTIART